MKGLRFYRSSVTEERTKGSLFFTHSEIEDGRSDFDYIFSPIYNDLVGNYILGDQWPIYDPNYEHKIHDKYVEYVVQDNQDYCLVTPEILKICGREIPEFDGNILLVVDNIPSKMEWRAYCNYEHDYAENIVCLLSNWDGVYWDIYATVDKYLNNLLKVHRDNKNLEIYRVDKKIDYPDPARKKEELECVSENASS